jgi:hypothetical protein
VRIGISLEQDDNFKPQKMKKTIFYSLLFILFNSCQTEQEIIEIKSFICPQLGKNNMLLYEYDNPNLEVYPIKFLFIQRDTVEPKSYSYHFLDQNFEIISGLKEYRGDSLLEYKTMIYLEEDGQQQKQVQEIDISEWQVPYQLKIGQTLSFSTDWESNVKSNLSYDYITTRKLISQKADFESMGDKIPVAVFRIDETYRIQSGTELNTHDIEMYMVYGKDVGLVEIKFFVEQQPKYLKLKRIYSEAELHEMF